MIAPSFGRRELLAGAAAALLAACDRPTRDGETIAPEALPEPSQTTARRPALVLAGPGVSLRLFLPVHVERMSEDPLAPVRIVSDAGVREAAMLYPAGDAPPPSDPEVRPVGQGAWLELDPKADVAALAEASPAAPGAKAWSLGLHEARFDWPAGLVVDAWAGDIPRVELRRFADPRDVMIVVRGRLSPDDVPGLADLVGPGQKQQARNATASPPWIEVTYTLAEEQWRQRHWRAVGPDGHIVLVTAQATAETASRVIADGDVLARSLTFTPK